MTDLAKRVVFNTIGALAAGTLIGAAVTFYDKPAAALGPLILIFSYSGSTSCRPRSRRR